MASKMLLLVLLGLLGFSECQAKVTNITLQAWELNALAATVKPLIVDAARNMTIAGTQSKHFDYSSFKFSTFDIANITVAFAPPNIVLSISGIEIALPSVSFELKDHILGQEDFTIHCHGHFSGHVDKTSISLGVSPTEKNQKLYLDNAKATTHFGSLSVSHKMDHTICKIADKLAGLLVDINKKIEDAIKDDLPKAISG
eukprot:gene9161-2983_t